MNIVSSYLFGDLSLVYKFNHKGGVKVMIEFKTEIAFWFCPLAVANATPSSSIWDFWS